MVVHQIGLESIVTRSGDHIASEVGGEVVILHMGRGTYYGLDEVGARIWGLLEQPRRVSAIRDALLAEYDVAPERCESELIELLGQLAVEELIEVGRADDPTLA